MIPISPPTDNLYKLIALFGLGILILGVVNLSTQQDQLIETKIEIEHLEKEIFDTIYFFDTINLSLQQKIQDELVSYTNIFDICEQIDEVEAFVKQDSKIPIQVKSDIITKIDIIEIKSSTIEKQELLDYLLIGLAILLMALGFFLWYTKEQRWKDLELVQKKEVQ